MCFTLGVEGEHNFIKEGSEFLLFFFLSRCCTFLGGGEVLGITHLGSLVLDIHAHRMAGMQTYNKDSRERSST